MRAIAVLPGKPNSIHLAELPKPSVHEIPSGRGILVHKAKARGVREKRYTTFSAFGSIDDDSEEAVDPSWFQRSGEWVGQGAFPP